MRIIDLIEKSNLDQDKKLEKTFNYFKSLIDELSGRELPSEIVHFINQEIEATNSFSGTNKGIKKQIRRSQSKILKLLEKELKIVTKNLFRDRWIAIGMSAFGLPLGVAFGSSIGNMGLIGLGIPIGMVIGMAVGAEMDKKALLEGRQLKL